MTAKITMLFLGLVLILLGATFNKLVIVFDTTAITYLVTGFILIMSSIIMFIELGMKRWTDLSKIRNFENQQLFSDYYIQRADFVKLDNVSIGYLIPGEKVTFRASLTATNVFTITDYDGLDPEISNGIDSNFYPRPRMYVLGLNFTF